ncbi:MAG: flavodoxin [Clostridia bacterium]|nr:flavodoxin [Clostridia bacterium]
MSKKIIGLIIAILIIVAAIFGIIYLVNNDVLGNKNEDNDSSKAVGTSIGNDENKNGNGEQDKNDTDNENDENSRKILIAYFSRADENYSVGTVEVGNTEIMAGFIRDYFGNNVDTFKIDPVNAYPANYNECTTVAQKEKNENARPEFKNPEFIDISKYDTIFLGYPIWWEEVPMVVNTFLEEYDFSGKTIIPFCTHEGSGNAGTFARLSSKLASSKVNTNGLAIRGTDARKEESRATVENWLKGLGF